MTGPLHPAELDSLAGRVDLKALHRKSILVTGAGGMIGNYLAQAITEVMRVQGFSPRRVIGLIRSKPHQLMAWAEQTPNVHYVYGKADFELDLPPSDIVAHLASPASPAKYGSKNEIWEANLGPTVLALTSEIPPEKFLFASSGEVYGPNNRIVTEHSPVTLWGDSNRSAYPNAKLATEKFLEVFSESCGVDAVSARVFHTFGPGVSREDGRSFADFLWSAAKSDPIFLYSDGRQIRPFSYIEDTVAALLMLLVTPITESTVNIAGKTEISIRDFAQLISDQSGLELVLSSNAHQGNRVESPVKTVQPDLGRIRSLGWEPKVDIAEAVGRTLGFLRTQV